MSDRTVSLVATRQKVEKYFPGANAGSQMLSAPFPIDPDACTTGLGRVLARHITTTRFDDDASRCLLVMPVTEVGLHMRDIAKRADVAELRDAAHAEQILTRLEADIEAIRRFMALDAEGAFRYRVTSFQWPVFGSKSAAEAETPEAFFDLCARQIYKTGGVPVRMGLTATGDDIPPGILRTLCNNRGVEMLRRWKEQQAKNNPQEAGI